MEASANSSVAESPLIKTRSFQETAGREGVNYGAALLEGPGSGSRGKLVLTHRG